jgi:hypothetical protein
MELEEEMITVRLQAYRFAQRIPMLLLLLTAALLLTGCPKGSGY